MLVRTHVKKMQQLLCISLTDKMTKDERKQVDSTNGSDGT